jgi:VIT1/CCC1 family predicted Fe2+/Mn2+ transporter
MTYSSHAILFVHERVARTSIQPWGSMTFKDLIRRFSAYSGPVSNAPEGSNAQIIQDNLDLVIGARTQLVDEMKAVDTRAGIVIALCSALAVATFAGAEPTWRGIALVFAFTGIAAGVVALLVGTLDGGEPGLKLIRNRVSSSTPSGTRLAVELSWMNEMAQALLTRKRWLLAAYSLFVALIVSVAIAYIIAYVRSFST